MSVAVLIVMLMPLLMASFQSKKKLLDAELFSTTKVQSSFQWVKNIYKKQAHLKYGVLVLFDYPFDYPFWEIFTDFHRFSRKFRFKETK
jgi:hypothetical protein